MYIYQLTPTPSNAFLASVEFVNDEADKRARAMERKFSILPANAGVLFVSIKAMPSSSGGGAEFHVRLGIARHLTEDTGRSLIRKVLEAERFAGLKMFVAVYRGVSGACRDDGTTTIGPSEN
jgi:hypothetical protein